MNFLDYSSTCPVVKYPSSAYGTFLNPNANYAYKEKRLLAEAEDRVKRAIGAKSGKVIFGGTSSQLIENLFGQLGEDTMIISSVYEHDAIAYFANRMDDINGIKDTMQSPTFSYQLIVCLMGVNNVTGQVMPIEEIGKLCKKYNAFFVCDMTAMIGHAPIPANIDDWCDMAVYSGHKCGTELGIGVMWLSKKFNDWLNGFKLHGTPNLAGALAMTQAVEDACDTKTIEKNNFHWGKLASKFSDLLCKNNIKHTFVPSLSDNFTCAINAIRLPGFNADALQQYLASKQIYVSIGGSACAEKHDYRVLNAYGLSNDEASEVIRVSFGEDSSVEDVEALVKGIKEFQNVYC